MKKIIIILEVVILLFIGGWFLYTKVIEPRLDARTVTAVVPMEIDNQVLEFGFTYPSGEEGYALIEPMIATTTIDGLKKAYILMETKEYIAFQNPVEGTKTPPSVSIFVLEMPTLSEEIESLGRMERLRAWAELYPQYSSIESLNGEVEEVVLDGNRVFRYQTEGETYRQEIYLANHQGNVYVFTGQFSEESDAIRTMYTELISSVLFN